MYKALRDNIGRPGDWIAIPGAGGGLGHLGAYPFGYSLNVKMSPRMT